MTAQRTLTAILHREGDFYVAECPTVGTVSQGSSWTEAVANLKEATELFLEEFPLPESAVATWAC
jgi:predicted RNase H-like HicB family nuclease